jgi:hypothetical protein
VPKVVVVVNHRSESVVTACEMLLSINRERKNIALSSFRMDANPVQHEFVEYAQCAV